MRYLELKNGLKDYLIFSLSDVKQLDPNFHRRRLNEWQDNDYIQKIIKGYYTFTDIKIDDRVLYYIANRIYAPSYISLEIALAYYNLIPESVYAVTSVSSRRKYIFNTKIGEFHYRAVKPKLFFGYNIVQDKGVAYKIADFEKAILDFLYLNPHHKTRKDFLGLRFNREVFWENINERRMERYLKRFDQKKLSIRVSKMMRYLQI